MINYLKYTELDKARVLFSAGLVVDGLAMFLADGRERSAEDISIAFGLTAGESLKLVRTAAKVHYATSRKINKIVYVKGAQAGVNRAREIINRYNVCIRSS